MKRYIYTDDSDTEDFIAIRKHKHNSVRPENSERREEKKKQQDLRNKRKNKRERLYG